LTKDDLEITAGGIVEGGSYSTVRLLIQVDGFHLLQGDLNKWMIELQQALTGQPVITVDVYPARDGA
jgi:hypothetical protein